MRRFKSKKNYKIINKKSCFIDSTVEIGEGVVIYENNRIYGKTKIADGTILLPNNFICDSTIGGNCEIDNSHIDGAIIGENVKIGPYARIRPKTKIADNCKIGNFVEIKKSYINDFTKIAHLSYIGDSVIGKNVNIGCGVVTCNYDGFNKHQTIIKDNSFIGSNVNLIAPIVIGSNCYIAAGSTIYNNVDDYEFVIERGKQVNKKEYAKKFPYIKNTSTI